MACRFDYERRGCKRWSRSFSRGRQKRHEKEAYSGRQGLGVRRLDDHRPHPDDLETPRRPKVIIAPDGGDAWAPAKPRPDNTLIRALGGAEPEFESMEEAQHILNAIMGRYNEILQHAPEEFEAIPASG